MPRAASSSASKPRSAGRLAAEMKLDPKELFAKLQRLPENVLKGFVDMTKELPIGADAPWIGEKEQKGGPPMKQRPQSLPTASEYTQLLLNTYGIK